ncbi:HupE/UreJ family protein [Inhella sp.]|uniref:HupE/UreJ family protein n=1 Tax=Inhella sp. TaxID=1921806 RepID=UPI0035B056EC
MRTVLLLLLLVGQNAFAHSGDHGLSGFSAGFSHPLSGADHLAAMLAVGLWGALTYRRPAEALRGPLVFAAALLLGALAVAWAGWLPPGVEPGIAVSLLGLGLLVAWRVPLPQPVALALIAVFAWMHGAAHGSELQGLAALLGMLAGTVLLHGLGLAAGALLRPMAARWAEGLGAGLMTFGALRLTGVL